MAEKSYAGLEDSKCFSRILANFPISLAMASCSASLPQSNMCVPIPTARITPNDLLISLTIWEFPE